MANRIRAITGLSASASVFNPSSLFYNAELGFIENLLGSSTLFQDSAGTTPAVLGSVIGRINSANGSGVYASQATTSKKPILKRMPTSGIRNLMINSGDILTGADWVIGLGWTMTLVNPFLNGEKGYRFKNDGAASSRNLSKTIGTSDGAARSLSTIFEKSSSDTAVASSIGIYNATTSSFVSRAVLNWSDGSVSNAVGSGGYAVKMADIGTNGGVVYRLVCTGSVPAGSIISQFLYPTSTGTNNHSVIVHGSQREIGSSATAYQSTIGGYDVFEPGFNQVYWLDYDGVDDELVLNNPDLGSNATRIRAQLGGPVIEQGLTLGANQVLNTDNLGLILLNRPLTSDELTAITNYYTRMVA